MGVVQPLTDAPHPRQDPCHRPSFARTSLGADDPYLLLGFLVAEAKFGGHEQPINNQMPSGDTKIDQLALPARSDNEYRRHFALRYAFGKFDKGPNAIIEDADWPPVWLVTFDLIAKIECAYIDA